MNQLLFFTILLLFASLHGAEPCEIFLSRHSGKSYDPMQDVTKEQLETLFEAARWAPSSHNDQPWNYIVCSKSLSPESYEKALSSLKEKKIKWVKNAPVIILAVTRPLHLYDNSFNKWAEYDTGQSTVSLALQASAMGLMAHQIGGYNREKIRADFGLPDEYKLMTMIILGYEKEPYSAVRNRRPIKENFFLGTWGNGFE